MMPMITTSGSLHFDLDVQGQTQVLSESGAFRTARIEFPDGEKLDRALDELLVELTLSPSSAARFSIAQITDLLLLPEGWDGYGSPEISASIADAASKCVTRISAYCDQMPVVVPTSSGGIQLEWTRDERLLELEFTSDDTIHYLAVDPASDYEEEEIINAGDWGEILRLIHWLQHGE